MIRSIAAALALALACAGLALAQPNQRPTVRIESGFVAGVIQDGARVFHAIPYAAPPVGPLRWRSPEPPPRWPGVRTAVAEGPACEQPVSAEGRPNGGGYAGPVSEDCLTLTVTAPLHAGHAPVMVWIPGGGNVFGAVAVPSYDATGFARDGVVVVVLNYRLGAFGFLAQPALAAEAAKDAPLGNYGLEDQIAALKWVRRNIAAFGGDPAKVTLAGESAGGADALALMTAPAARGLYSKAIVESGGGWTAAADLAHREAQGAALTAKLGLPATAAAADLRAIPAERVLAAQGSGWGPTVDGRLLTETTATAFARGDEAHVPMIIGSNSFEASLLKTFGGDPSRLAEAAPPALKAAYANDGADEDRLGEALFGDRAMGAPARWIAGRQSAYAPTYLYYFSYVILAHRSQQRGANHAGEIPFAFDSQEKVPGRAAMLTDDDRAATRLMHACWVGFIATGAPDCQAGGRVWPAYQPATDELMEFGVTSGVRQHLRKRQLDAQDAVEALLLRP